jgi:hypothetical protein
MYKKGADRGGTVFQLFIVGGISTTAYHISNLTRYLLLELKSYPGLEIEYLR